MTFLGPNGLFLGLGLGSKPFFWSTHVAKQLLFFIVLSILTFEFDLILGSFLRFLGPNGLFLGLGWGSKTVFWSTHVAEQLLFSIVLSILTFDFG